MVLEEAKKDAVTLGLDAVRDPETIPTDEEWKEIDAQQKANVEKAKKLAGYTEDEMDAIARTAIQERYDLDNQQLKLLDYVTESSWWYLKNGQAYYSLYYGLNQKEEWSAGDGIYIVDVNAQTGEVDAIIYDTGLLGNG